MWRSFNCERISGDEREIETKAQNASKSKSFSGKQSENLLSGADSLKSEEALLTPTVLSGTFLFYFLVFHNLANLPLGDRLLYGIHQRFWMQPNILFFIFCGVGYEQLAEMVSGLGKSSKSGRRGNGNAVLIKINSNNSKSKKSSGTKKLVPVTPSRHSSPFLSLVFFLGAVGASFLQAYTWFGVSDQSKNTHFRDYARALLAPLPKESNYFINYDQQWTSVRYMQKCVGFRDDITTINLSMMTYKWFREKHHLYPRLTIPKGYLSHPQGRPVAKGEAFTLKQLLDVNVPRGQKFYLSGKLSHPDPDFDAEYTFVPTGLVSAIVSSLAAPNGTAFADLKTGYWKAVSLMMPTLPDQHKYPEETWEWTIGRDFKDRLGDSAAYLLQTALQIASDDPYPLLDAVYWLETAVLVETSNLPADGSRRVPFSLLKNAGLAHVHLLQNVRLRELLEIQSVVGLPYPEDLFQTARVLRWPGQEPANLEWLGEAELPEPKAGDHTNDRYLESSQEAWRKWSVDRFVFHWGAFLVDPDSKEGDSQYETIRNMYLQATGKGS